MSIELVLIPLALAAISAAKAAKMGSESPEGHVQVQSRLKDGYLLSAALTDVGATVSHQTDEWMLATFSEGELKLNRTGTAPWVAHFGDGWSQEAAINLVGDLDAAYGLRVQKAVVARLRDRLPGAGMTLESERVEDDRTVTMMLRVEA